MKPSTLLSSAAAISLAFLVSGTAAFPDEVGGLFIRGNANGDTAVIDGKTVDVVDISDAIYTLEYRFLGGPAPPCMDAADVNDDGDVDISDPIVLLWYLFLGGPPPPHPVPGGLRDFDPTLDGLDCCGGGKDRDCDGVEDEREIDFDCGGDPSATSDTDGDGLLDGHEAMFAGSSPCLADTDGDGLSDRQEFEQGTDPISADPDGDGLTDPDELAAGTDPGRADTDGDGQNDREELEEGADGFVTDPRRPDSDGDGLTDGEEAASGTDPHLPDTDGDGIDDRQEILTGDDGAVTDPRRADGDQDGLTDPDEIAAGTDPFRADTDNDGLLDGAEAARGLDPLKDDDRDGDQLKDALEMLQLGTDPTRKDSDGDGLDDFCEVRRGLAPLDPSDRDEDPDRDGLSNHDECAAGTDPNLGDTDGDTLSDGDEAKDLGTSPANPDTDGDGLDDGAEVRLGLHPLQEDSDGDGIGDGKENPPDGDADADGLLNALDGDADNDGLADGEEDQDHDGVLDPGEPSPVIADTDRDGIPDGFEIAMGLNPLDGGDADDDPDGDGLDNAGEYLQGADPFKSDTDGDGVTDRLERDNGMNPLNPQDASQDFDFDGLTNLQEIAAGTDPNDPDYDDDLVLDGSEHDPQGDPDGDGIPNLRDPDSDGDGISDGKEPSPLADTDGDGLANVVDTDSDNDGVRDGAEAAIGSSPLVSDTDGDNLPDGVENADGDGEVGAGETDPADPDTDGDGIADGEEAIPGADGHITDPLLADTDGDGVGDGLEIAIATDPTRADTDADGLTDGEEVAGGSNPKSRDTDGDGAPDGEESFTADPDGDGIASIFDPDSDNDGLPDGEEIRLGYDGLLVEAEDLSGATAITDPVFYNDGAFSDETGTGMVAEWTVDVDRLKPAASSTFRVYVRARSLAGGAPNPAMRLELRYGPNAAAADRLFPVGRSLYEWYHSEDFQAPVGDEDLTARVRVVSPDRIVADRFLLVKSDEPPHFLRTLALESDTDRDGLLDGEEVFRRTFWFEAEDDADPAWIREEMEGNRGEVASNGLYVQRYLAGQTVGLEEVAARLSRTDFHFPPGNYTLFIRARVVPPCDPGIQPCNPNRPQCDAAVRTLHADITIGEPGNERLIQRTAVIKKDRWEWIRSENPFAVNAPGEPLGIDISLSTAPPPPAPENIHIDRLLLLPVGLGDTVTVQAPPTERGYDHLITLDLPRVSDPMTQDSDGDGVRFEAAQPVQGTAATAALLLRAFDPCLSDDGLTLYCALFDLSLSSAELGAFTRPDSKSPFDAFSNAKFQLINLALGTHRAPFVTPDGLEVFFASDRAGGSGGFDLYRAVRSDPSLPFDAPVNLAAVNSSSGEDSPSLSADRLRLYFHSGRPRQSGEGEFFMAKRPARDKPFTAAIRLPPLHQEGKDRKPFMTADERTIFFASDVGSGGLPDMDLFVARRGQPGADFGPAEAIVEANSSPSSETSPFLAGSGTLYFNTDRSAASPPIWSVKLGTPLTDGYERQELYTNPLDIDTDDDADFLCDFAPGACGPALLDPATGRAVGDGIFDDCDARLGSDFTDNTDPNPLSDDNDEDGLPRGLETLISINADLDADQDDDGLVDGDEDVTQDARTQAYETDPRNLDTDGDNLSDGLERGVTAPALRAPPILSTDPVIFVPDRDPSSRTDPVKTDADGDGIADGVEDGNLDGKFVFNASAPPFELSDPSAPDTDGDGYRDDLELKHGDGDVTNYTPGKDTHPANPDTDGDGLADGEEVSTYRCDPLKTHSDSDGSLGFALSDWDELHPDGSHPFVTRPGADDTDGDGLLDGDEYVLGSNPLRRDADGDGMPDGSEHLPAADSDGDGKRNILDPDSDGDALPDGQEVDPLADTDGDGKKNVIDLDSDGDGWLDGIEVASLTSMTQKENVPTFIRIGNLRLDVSGGRWEPSGILGVFRVTAANVQVTLGPSLSDPSSAPASLVQSDNSNPATLIQVDTRGGMESISGSGRLRLRSSRPGEWIEIIDGAYSLDPFTGLVTTTIGPPRLDFMGYSLLLTLPPAVDVIEGQVLNTAGLSIDHSLFRLKVNAVVAVSTMERTITLGLPPQGESCGLEFVVPSIRSQPIVCLNLEEPLVIDFANSDFSMGLGAFSIPGLDALGGESQVVYGTHVSFDSARGEFRFSTGSRASLQFGPVSFSAGPGEFVAKLNLYNGRLSMQGYIDALLFAVEGFLEVDPLGEIRFSPAFDPARYPVVCDLIREPVADLEIIEFYLDRLAEGIRLCEGGNPVPLITTSAGTPGVIAATKEELLDVIDNTVPDGFGAHFRYGLGGAVAIPETPLSISGGGSASIRFGPNHTVTNMVSDATVGVEVGAFTVGLGVEVGAATSIFDLGDPQKSDDDYNIVLAGGGLEQGFSFNLPFQDDRDNRVLQFAVGKSSSGLHLYKLEPDQAAQVFVQAGAVSYYGFKVASSVVKGSLYPKAGGSLGLRIDVNGRLEIPCPVQTLLGWAGLTEPEMPVVSFTVTEEGFDSCIFLSGNRRVNLLGFDFPGLELRPDGLYACGGISIPGLCDYEACFKIHPDGTVEIVEMVEGELCEHIVEFRNIVFTAAGRVLRVTAEAFIEGIGKVRLAGEALAQRIELRLDEILEPTGVTFRDLEELTYRAGENIAEGIALVADAYIDRARGIVERVSGTITDLADFRLTPLAGGGAFRYGFLGAIILQGSLQVTSGGLAISNGSITLPGASITQVSGGIDPATGMVTFHGKMTILGNTIDVGTAANPISIPATGQRSLQTFSLGGSTFGFSLSGSVNGNLDKDGIRLSATITASKDFGWPIGKKSKTWDSLSVSSNGRIELDFPVIGKRAFDLKNFISF